MHRHPRTAQIWASCRWWLTPGTHVPRIPHPDLPCPGCVGLGHPAGVHDPNDPWDTWCYTCHGRGVVPFIATPA